MNNRKKCDIIIKNIRRYLNMKIILASASPRRKELLGLIVPNFEIYVSTVEEKITEGLSPKEQAINLSYIKAKDIMK